MSSGSGCLMGCNQGVSQSYSTSLFSLWVLPVSSSLEIKLLIICCSLFSCFFVLGGLCLKKSYCYCISEFGSAASTSSSFSFLDMPWPHAISFSGDPPWFSRILDVGFPFLSPLEKILQWGLAELCYILSAPCQVNAKTRRKVDLVSLTIE